MAILMKLCVVPSLLLHGSRYALSAMRVCLFAWLACGCLMVYYQVIACVLCVCSSRARSAHVSMCVRVHTVLMCAIHMSLACNMCTRCPHMSRTMMSVTLPAHVARRVALRVVVTAGTLARWYAAPWTSTSASSCVSSTSREPRALGSFTHHLVSDDSDCSVSVCTRTRAMRSWRFRGCRSKCLLVALSPATTSAFGGNQMGLAYMGVADL